MKININNLVSISEANQNFSKVARLVDENGAAVILKNNVPRYVLIEYSQLENEETIGDEEVEEVAKRVLSKHMKAFEELAKWKDLTKTQILKMHSLLIQETGGSNGIRDEELVELGLGLADSSVSYKDLLNWIIDHS